MTWLRQEAVGIVIVTIIMAMFAGCFLLGGWAFGTKVLAML